MAFDRLQFLTGYYWTEDLASLLTDGQRLPQFFAMWSFHFGKSEVETMISYNLILGVSFNVCHILLVRTRSNPHAKGGDDIGHEDQKMGVPGSHL